MTSINKIFVSIYMRMQSLVSEDLQTNKIPPNLLLWFVI